MWLCRGNFHPMCYGSETIKIMEASAEHDFGHIGSLECIAQRIKIFFAQQHSGSKVTEKEANILHHRRQI